MDHDHSLSTRRIEAFSDGVFAIIVTLLVLDLKIPDIAVAMTNTVAINVLVHLIPQFLSFLLSFFIVCIFWVNHHHFFYSLKKSDSKLLCLINLLLFWLCFIPFPTPFLGSFPTNEIAGLLFDSVLFFPGRSFSLVIHY